MTIHGIHFCATPTFPQLAGGVKSKQSSSLPGRESSEDRHGGNVGDMGEIAHLLSWAWLVVRIRGTPSQPAS